LEEDIRDTGVDLLARQDLHLQWINLWGRTREEGGHGGNLW